MRKTRPIRRWTAPLAWAVWHQRQRRKAIISDSPLFNVVFNADNVVFGLGNVIYGD